MKPKAIELLEQIKLFPWMKEKKEVLSEGCYVKNKKTWTISRVLFKRRDDNLIMNFYNIIDIHGDIITRNLDYWTPESRLFKILGKLPTYMDLLVCLWDDYFMDMEWIYCTSSLSLEYNIVEWDELHEQPDSVLDEIIILLKEKLWTNKNDNK